MATKHGSGGMTKGGKLPKGKRVTPIKKQPKGRVKAPKAY